MAFENNQNVSVAVPNGITCQDWKMDPADIRGRRCINFIPDRMCGLPEYLICTEWLKRQPRPSIEHPLPLVPPEPEPAMPEPEPATAPATPSARAVLARSIDPPILAARAYPAPLAAQAEGKAPAPAQASESAPFVCPKEIDPFRIAELEALTSEIHLVSPELGDVFLVRRHTGASRHELTYHEAATLRQLVDQFPGARVVALQPAQPPAEAPADWDT